MAKDPAFLFYPGDWQGGTMTMSRHIKGCYIDLLVAQFNSGPLSLEEIKIVLGADFGSWPALSKKFKTNDIGLFFNERLAAEKAKRIEHSQKQKERVNKRWNKYGNDSGNTAVLPLENENENENELKTKSEKKVSRGTDIPIPIPFGSQEFTAAWDEWNQYRIERKKQITPSTAKRQLQHLARYPEPIAIKMIEQSITHGWEGLFELKENYNGKSINKFDRTQQNRNDISIILNHASDSEGS
jgi:hypothetical protein